MPAKTDKQQRFFFAAERCKKDGNCKGKLKKAADSMTLSQIKDFTKRQLPPAEAGSLSFQF